MQFCIQFVRPKKGKKRMVEKWEYKIIDSQNSGSGKFWTCKSTESAERYLNILGAEGWEVINIDVLELEGRREFVGLAKREIH